jgi:hypothetical protein
MEVEEVATATQDRDGQKARQTKQARIAKISWKSLVALVQLCVRLTTILGEWQTPWRLRWSLKVFRSRVCSVE